VNDALMNRGAQWGALVAILGVTMVAAAIGGVASVRAPDFYQQLVRPSWGPSPKLFGPVWTVLYILMAVAAWLVVRARGWPDALPAIAVYLFQLALNALWTWLFFRWRTGAGAFAEIVLLWVFILLTIRMFWQARPLAGALLLPYLAWVTFASALCYAMWRRNPGLL
jgi:benzodiazapine receptor